MNVIKKKYLAVPALLALSLACAAPVAAQGTASRPDAVGGFIGFTDRYNTDFTFGAEYEHQLQQARPWSVGGLVEFTPDVRFGNDDTVALATAHYRPASLSRLKLTGGAGIEFRENAGDHARFRLGAGYDIFRENRLTITPRVAVDFGEGDENVVFGVSGYYDF